MADALAMKFCPVLRFHLDDSVKRSVSLSALIAKARAEDEAARADRIRRGVEVAHRRWGKDDVALHFTATQAMQVVGNYWHLLPLYSQGRKVIWNAVNPKTGKKRVDEAFPMEIRSKTLNDQMLIEFKTGSTWQLVGSDTYNTLVGSPPVGITFSEWALANPLAWAYLGPVLEENGGWALFIYTSRGANHGKTMLEHAQAQRVERLSRTRRILRRSEAQRARQLQPMGVGGRGVDCQVAFRPCACVFLLIAEEGALDEMEERRCNCGIDGIGPGHRVDDSVLSVADLIAQVIERFPEAVPCLVVVRVPACQVLVQLDRV